MGDGVLSFVKVKLPEGTDLGTNDLRFGLFHDQIRRHTDWDTVFLTDITDVRVNHNPCGFVNRDPKKLYVMDEASLLKSSDFCRDRYTRMGGKYMAWYMQAPTNMSILNAGVIGGKRERVLELIDHMNDVMQDPGLQARKNGEEVNVNMGALNWVLHNKYPRGSVISGAPLHSAFKKH